MDAIEKARNKQARRRNNKIRKWWDENGYIVLRIIFFYIYIPGLLWCKYTDKRFKELTWDEDICKKYLDKAFPILAAYYCEGSDILISDTEYFGDMHFYWSFTSNYAKKKFPALFRYVIKFSEQIKDYIINKYEIDGYSKMVLDNWVAWSRAREKFGWYNSYNSDYAKGVVFYKEE